MARTNGKPVAVIDVDDVKMDFVDGLARWHNKAYGERNNVYLERLKREHFRDWDLTKTFGGEKEDIIRKVNEFYWSPSFLTMSTVPGAVPGIRMFSRTYGVLSCTGRPSQIELRTQYQIRRFFGDYIKPESIRSLSLFIEKKKKKPKSSVINEEHEKGRRIGFFVEDCMDIMEEVVKNTVEVAKTDGTQFPLYYSLE